MANYRISYQLYSARNFPPIDGVPMLTITATDALNRSAQASRTLRYPD